MLMNINNLLRTMFLFFGFEMHWSHDADAGERGNHNPTARTDQTFD